MALVFGACVLAACSNDPPPVGLDAGAAPDVDAGPLFEQVPLSLPAGEEPNFFDIWGTDYDDIYVVGEAATILHFDGVAWSRVFEWTTSTSPPDLRAVWGSGSDDVYAVGTGGTVLHYFRPDAPPGQPEFEARWVQEPLAGAQTIDLNGIWGDRRGQSPWVCGNNGKVFARNPMTGWTEAPSDSLENLNGIWISDDGADGVSVGNLGAITRMTGRGPWTAERIEGLNKPLKDVWGRGVGSLYIVGLEGTLLRAEDTAWVAVENTPLVYLRDLYGLGGRNAFIVGWNGTILETNGNDVFAYFDITDQRLEGAFATREPDPTVPPAPAGADAGPPPLRQAFYLVGVSGTILKGPFGISR